MTAEQPWDRIVLQEALHIGTTSGGYVEVLIDYPALTNRSQPWQLAVACTPDAARKIAATLLQKADLAEKEFAERKRRSS